MRTTRLILAGLCALAVKSAPAFAATTVMDTMSGTAANVCGAGAAQTLNFAALVDTTTGATTAAATSTVSTGADTSAVCNQARTQVTVQHTDLYTTNTSSTGFTNRITITSAKVVSAQNNTGATDSTAATTNGTGLSTGFTTALGNFGAFSSLTVSVIASGPSTTNTAGGATGASPLLVGGSYTGTVQITLTAAS